ncbi:transketolase, partial [candidate division KSB1 bacterium]|nr:transketolase [candidate division KSB1 bacterium]
CWIYDNNRITIEGSTELAFSEDVAARFTAYGWQVLHVTDANNLDDLHGALQTSIATKGKPSLIIIDSHIAFGAPNKQDTASAHGEPLGEAEIRAAKTFYGWDADKTFYIPEKVKEFTKTIQERGQKHFIDWQRLYDDYSKQHPDLGRVFEQMQKGELPAGWDKNLPVFPADEKGLATRQSNGKVLNAVAGGVPWLLGGAADLLPSTKTAISGSNSITSNGFNGRNYHFGIREFGMGAIVNGMALSKLRPFGATFFVFSDYMRPAIRLAALMEIPSLFIFTHDSIGLGEDGPTHQPVEHLASLRAMPNLDVIRPADANEVSVLWKHIMKIKDHPVALVLSRQNVPTIDRTHYAPAEGALRGAYIIADCQGQPEVILMATGSEVHLCLQALEQLRDKVKVRLLSMPCWELFERQSANYKQSVLPEAVNARMAVEAGATLGWHKYTGSRGIVLGVDQFGASAPHGEVYKKYGLTVERVVESIKQLISEP